MKTRLWLLALVGAVLFGGSGAAWADGDFYVIAGGGAAVGTKITSVPYTISNPGFYYVTSNLSPSGPGQAITVNANDVTIDLMGFSLTGPGASTASSTAFGIYMSGRTNVEVRNGTVAGFYKGIYSDNLGDNGHRVLNVRATYNATGIQLIGDNFLVKNCHALNNTDGGIYITSGMINDCVACNNAIGITLLGPGSVIGNTANINTYVNFWLEAGAATSIMADRNSAFGLSVNYFVFSGTTGVAWGFNAGSP